MAYVARAAQGVNRLYLRKVDELESRRIPVVTATGDPQIYAQSLETGERRALGRGVGAPYLPSGQVVYGVGSSLFALPFDAKRLEVAGNAVKVVDNVFNKGAVPQAAFSRVGSIAFLPTTPPPLTLVWVDRRGEERSLNVPTRSYLQPRLAPDEQRLAVLIAGEDYSADVWLWDFSRGNLSRFTDDGGYNGRLTFSFRPIFGLSDLRQQPGQLGHVGQLLQLLASPAPGARTTLAQPIDNQLWFRGRGSRSGHLDRHAGREPDRYYASRRVPSVTVSIRRGSRLTR